MKWSVPNVSGWGSGSLKCSMKEYVDDPSLFSRCKIVIAIKQCLRRDVESLKNLEICIGRKNEDIEIAMTRKAVIEAELATNKEALQVLQAGFPYLNVCVTE